MATQKTKMGPDSSRVADQLVAEIEAGRFPVGQFMPCTRELGQRLNVSPETVRRALKMLEDQKWVRAEPRHGFQVLCRSGERETPTLAYVLSDDTGSTIWDGFSGFMLRALQKAARNHGVAVIGIAADRSSAADLVRQIQSTSVSGVLLDTLTPGLFEAVAEMRLPTVAVEVWNATSPFDAVVQDGFGGGFQAADYLVQRGHRRIAWLGPVAESVQSMERWGGAVAALRRNDIEISREQTLEKAAALDTGQVEAFLSRPDRPTGVISLWGAIAMNAVKAAARVGLRNGRDIDIVGWTTEEQFKTYQTGFPDGQVPATVTWRIASLAEAALSRMAERRAKPDLATVRINIGTRLRAGSQGPAVVET